MIYDNVTITNDIQQGDIFFDLPYTAIDLSSIEILRSSENGTETRVNWNDVQEDEEVSAKLPITKTVGIVASQDCDNLRNPLISFFQIGTLTAVSGRTIPTNQKRFRSLIFDAPPVSGYKWFYLPTGEPINFREKMAVDFEVIFQVPRTVLQNNIGEFRKGRLKTHALEHYRKSMMNYFTRYAYNKWYSLTREEFQDYLNSLSPEERASVTPYPGQEQETEQ